TGTSTTEIYTLSLHDALPISARARLRDRTRAGVRAASPACRWRASWRQNITSVAIVKQSHYCSARYRYRSTSNAFRSLAQARRRSEEHTSELQSRENLVCRLL